MDKNTLTITGSAPLRRRNGWAWWKVELPISKDPRGEGFSTLTYKATEERARAAFWSFRNDLIVEDSGLSYAAGLKAVTDLPAEEESRGGVQKSRVTTPAPVGMDEAIEFLKAYTGTFPFLLDLKARVAKLPRLSEKQVAAVLKCKAREEGFRKEKEERIEQTRKIEAAGEGFYKADGTIYKVQKAVHGSGNLYAKALRVTDGKGKWEYAPGMIRKLSAENRLTLEEAKEFGHLYGVCGVCGRTLTDEASIEAGIGPICGGRLESAA